MKKRENTTETSGSIFPACLYTHYTRYSHFFQYIYIYPNAFISFYSLFTFFSISNQTFEISALTHFSNPPLAMIS